MESEKEAVKRINQTLKSVLSRRAPQPGKIPTAVEGVYLYRMHKDERLDCFNDPCIGVLVQGEKRALVADKEYCFGEGWYIAYGMDLPAISHISGATPENPHLALSVPLDRYLLTQLAAEVEPQVGSGQYKGVTIAEATPDLLDACLRLVNLLDTPQRIPVLAPLIIKEIHYLLLTGPQGEDFRLLGIQEAPHNRIARAAVWLRSHYREPFNLAELAAQFYMSQTSFCRHFNRITGMTPLQFQKRLRLYEAQRFMLTEDTSAEKAAFAVGYESPTQFNREYKRQFGEPPRRSIKQTIS